MSDTANEHIKDTLGQQKDLLALTYTSEKDIKLYWYVLAKTQKITDSIAYVIGKQNTASTLIKAIEESSIGLATASLHSVHNTADRREVLAHITELVGLLSLGGTTSVLSKNNAQTLINACVELAQVLHETGWFSHHRFVSPDLLQVDEPHVSADTPHALLMRKTDLGHSRDRDSVQETWIAPAQQRPETYQGQSRTAPKSHYIEKVQKQQKDRRAIILGILQQKDRITIKDVTNVIRDVSEKTVQRELLGLVDQGVLKKEGERRWSTYTLA